jgi:hypothetical protein
MSRGSSRLATARKASKQQELFTPEIRATTIFFDGA